VLTALGGDGPTADVDGMRSTADDDSRLFIALGVQLAYSAMVDLA